MIMLTRKDLKQFNFENPPDFALQRTVEIQKKYDEYMKDKRNTSGFLESVREKMEGKKFCLLKNDFPYDIEKGIVHLVCWYTDENPYTIISKMKSEYNIVTCWKNKPGNCSVPEIKHIHFFVNQ